jgi:hypothetical protein
MKLICKAPPAGLEAAPRPRSNACLQELAFGWALKIVPDALVPAYAQLYGEGNASVLSWETGSRPVAWLRFSDKYGNLVRTRPAGTSLLVSVAAVREGGAASSQKVNTELTTSQLSDSFSADEMGFRWAGWCPCGTRCELVWERMAAVETVYTKFGAQGSSY